MVLVKRLVLDVLKPHQPNALEFAQAIATAGGECRVRVMVIEVDEHTESLQVVLEGDAIDFETVQSNISNLGASLHSIDEVEVQGDEEAG
jgi:hypothetical protein